MPPPPYCSLPLSPDATDVVRRCPPLLSSVAPHLSHRPPPLGKLSIVSHHASVVRSRCCHTQPPAAVSAEPINITPITVNPIAAHRRCRQAYRRRRASDPPMIKVVDVDRHMYHMKRSTARASLAKRRRGGGYPTVR